jgi:3-deoxy-D-arabino-heptulosonate 7-phosphate (DAHP) synthase class II
MAVKTFFDIIKIYASDGTLIYMIVNETDSLLHIVQAVQQKGHMLLMSTDTMHMV